MQNENIAVHDKPIWKNKADYILQVDLTPYGLAERHEQIWAKRLASRRFKICCIPFFTYGYALGDTVEANEADLIVGIVRKGPHRNLRIAISKAEDATRIHVVLHEWAEGGGALYEWFEKHYLAVNLPSQTNQPDLALIRRMAKAREIAFEIDG